MEATRFLEKLSEKPMLCDGGMGTQLIEAGLGSGACGVAWNVDNPEAVQGVHRRYLEAGCDLITTNTFQGSRRALMMHGVEHRTTELNKAAARIAKLVTDAGAVVLADVGPFGDFLEPLGDTTAEELEDIFTEQLAALYEGGADAVIIETMSDPAEVVTAIGAARGVSDWPIISTYAFQMAGEGAFRTMMGATVGDALQQAIDAGAHVVGANCGTELGLKDYVRLAAQLVEAAGETPVIIQPNAGSPKTVDGQLVYSAKPGDMAGVVGQFLKAGVRIVGGCCGTTPAHLKAMNEVMP